jgi:hypothetical protein
VSGETGIVAFHWNSAFETTVILVFVAANVFVVQEPLGPHRTLPVLAEVSVAQLMVIVVWTESVR